jgi:dipeptidyl aminopeptidase/acylaminoacyl peptidase
MKTDIRQTPLFLEAQELHTLFRQPGSGQISDASEVNLAPDGADAVFSATIIDRLEGSPPTRVCSVNMATGDIRVLTFGPHSDRLPKYSPDGRSVAFLSDRDRVGDFQLYLLDPVRGAAKQVPPVDGWVEYFHWSPDGKRILLGVAGHGADISGGQGAEASKQRGDVLPSWTPSVATGDESYRWRRAWIYDLATDRAHEVDVPEINVWEAVWCGNASIAAVVSPEPGEDTWYTARLHIVDLENGGSRELYVPQDQLGWPATSPSGRHLAVVEAVCSDRLIVAGDLCLIDVESGKVRRVDTHGVDVTYTEWRLEGTLLIAGHRGFETVLGIVDLASGSFGEAWASAEITTGGRYVTVSGPTDQGGCALIGEGYHRAPEIAVIRDGKYRTVRSFDLGYAEYAKFIEPAGQVLWKAPDELDIQGWLLRPSGTPPHPLVVCIHGGPVFQWRPTWLARSNMPVLMLLQRGYAVFFPNPRGSSGRGQGFARRVKGDMNGADSHDILSGIDHLVACGIADPKRIGVTGGSYGGNMAAWLITQDSRFVAAVPVSPHTNQVTQRLLSNIPRFVDLFLGDEYTNLGGKYFQCSPVMHAHKVRTPTLIISGALDRCTPPEEAVQFHNALLENGVRSVLVIYPEEGHGARGKLPAAIDHAARLVSWFDEHMGTSTEAGVSVRTD